MDFKLNDMGALVSGSTKGIGPAIAVKPAREGYGVIVDGQSGEARFDAPGRRPGSGRAS